MSKVIYYDSNNKVFQLLDKPYNRPSRLIREIKADQDDQLQLIADLLEFIEFLNKPDSGIIRSYILQLKVSLRWSS